MRKEKHKHTESNEIHFILIVRVRVQREQLNCPVWRSKNECRSVQRPGGPLDRPLARGVR